MRTSTRWLIGWLMGCPKGCLALAMGLAAGCALAAPPPAEHFTRKPSIGDVRPSPDGRRLAMIVRTDSGGSAVAVLDLPPRAAPRVVAGFKEADIWRVRWVNNDRLVFDAAEPETIVPTDGAGTIAVDHDGKNMRPLIAWRRANNQAGTRIAVKLLTYGWWVHQTLRDGSPDIIVREEIQNAVGEVTDRRLARLNTLTGDTRPLTLGAPDNASNHVLDAAGEVRVLLSTFQGRTRLQVRRGERWDVLEEHPTYSGAVLFPRYLEADGQLVVATQRGGTGTWGLHSYDIERARLDPEPLVRTSRFDVGDAIVDPQVRRVTGAQVLTDRPQTVWFSPRMAQLQKAIDGALPKGRINTLLCTACESSPFYVVFSRSDRHPGEYLLYDNAQQKLSRIGERYPWIDEAAQGARTFHWVAARDGLQLPVVLTHPPGRTDKQALPAVLVVHGGPWVRGTTLVWQAEPQFLATRGWRVIEVDFRGSTGLGGRHFEAGFKQWGRAMQDDLEDALKWAAAEGWINPGQVCIYGGSYGGYAALMGPVRNPGTYRCAASHVGVTDLELMFSRFSADFNDEFRSYGMSVLIGDPSRDAESLRSVSPLHRVADIKVPVLIAHGTLDRRVPRDHADAFESAARKAGVAIERVDYGDEGHGWVQPKNHADFLARLEKFMARSLAP